MKVLKSVLRNLVIFGTCWQMFACGGGVETENNNDQNPPSDIVQLNAFALGVEYPVDMIIPDVESMRHTAFIATDGLALGVLPVDLDTMSLSENFETFDATPNNIASVLSYASDLEILSPELGFLLGGTGLASFNPTTGQHKQSLSFDQEIQLNDPVQLSRPIQGQNTILGNFLPNFASHVAIVENQVFVTMSNRFADEEFKSYFVQGMLLVFNLQNGQLIPSNPYYIILPGFNASGLTVYQNSLYVTLTGATEFAEGGQVPLTDSKIVKINPQTLTVEEEINLGKVAASYSSLAISDSGKAFIGSAAYSEVYEFDLISGQVLRGEVNPIVISDKEIDYIVDQKIHPSGNRLFVSSYNNNYVRAVDLGNTQRPVEKTIWDFDMEVNPGLTGAGAMAFRLGEAGVDYIGHDLMVLTGNPGTLSTALTNF